MNRFRKKFQQAQPEETDPPEKKPALRDFRESTEGAEIPMKQLLAEDTKARIWMWWPYLAALVIISGVIAATFYFFFKPGEKSEEAGIRSRLVKLSEISAFRDAYIEANGGQKELAELKSISSSGTLESGGQTISFRSIKRRPDKSITTLKMPEFDLSFIVNGDKVWQRVKSPEGEPFDTLKVGPEAEAIRELGRFFDLLMDTVLNEPASIVSITPDAVDGKDCLLLNIDASSRGIKARVYVDPVEMTPFLRLEDFSDGSQRKVVYSDFRQVDGGILEAFKVETYRDEMLQNRVILEKCAANPGILSSIFEYTGKENEEVPKEESR